MTFFGGEGRNHAVFKVPHWGLLGIWTPRLFSFCAWTPWTKSWIWISRVDVFWAGFRGTNCAVFKLTKNGSGGLKQKKRILTPEAVVVLYFYPWSKSWICPSLQPCAFNGFSFTVAVIECFLVYEVRASSSESKLSRLACLFACCYHSNKTCVVVTWGVWLWRISCVCIAFSCLTVLVHTQNRNRQRNWFASVRFAVV